MVDTLSSRSYEAKASDLCAQINKSCVKQVSFVNLCGNRRLLVTAGVGKIDVSKTSWKN